jgi:hypothetical protein
MGHFGTCTKYVYKIKITTHKEKVGLGKYV